MKAHSLAMAALAAMMAISLQAGPSAAAPAAGSWTVGDLVISDAYARATLPHAPVGGGFIAITNKGGTDDTLVSAASPVAGTVQLHDISMDNGVMKMREVSAGVPVPAGKTVTFSPSGLHLMFTELKDRFVKGKTVPVTLTFAKAGTVTVDLAVGDIAAKGPPGASDSGATGDAMSGMKM
jgi:copper(I)-binding protein